MKNLNLKATILFTIINLICISAFSQYNNALRIKITGNGYSDETIIRLVNGASQNFDGNYDAWKMFSPNPNVPSIYTAINTGQALSINSLPEFTKDTSITIYTNIPANGNYVINIEEVYAFTSNYKMSLSDITSNTDFLLLGDTSLSFSFNTQQNSPSFTFNISTPLVLTTIDESCVDMDDGSTTILNEGNADWNIQVYDESNNLVLDSISNSSVTNYDNLSPGIYNAIVTSKGIIDNASFIVAPAVNLTSNFNTNKDTIYLNEGGDIDIVNTSINAQNYSWDLGDGGSTNSMNPNYIYSTVGEYQISLTSLNDNCEAISSQQITVLQSKDLTTSIEKFNTNDVKINNYGNGNYQINTTDNQTKKIVIYDTKGSIIYNNTFTNNSYNFSLSNNASGIYIINVTSDDNQMIQKKLYR